MFVYIEITSMRDDGIRSTERSLQLEVTGMSSAWSIKAVTYESDLNYGMKHCNVDVSPSCVCGFILIRRWTVINGIGCELLSMRIDDITFIPSNVWGKTRVSPLLINMIYVMRVIILVEIEAKRIFWPKQTIYNTSNRSNINDKMRIWKIITNAFIVVHQITLLHDLIKARKKYLIPDDRKNTHTLNWTCNIRHPFQLNCIFIPWFSIQFSSPEESHSLSSLQLLFETHIKSLAHSHGN